ncbi:MAG: NACHT domain-containing protein [Leptolyngbyaceae cyanobacterium]
MQEELPRDFLVAIARKYSLTKLEEDAFVETFHAGRTDAVIIKVLNLTLSAYRSRMGNVYTKFSFRDGGRGKRARLQYFLNEQYRQSNGRHSLRSGKIDIEELVDELNSRLREKIQNECGSMRVLAMTRPLDLSNIFTEVNILEQVSHHQRLRLDDLNALHADDNHLNPFSFARQTVEKVSGVDYVQRQEKLLVLGRPGAGKTTFLKHLATQCSARKLFSNYLPIFVVLRKFAEVEGHPSLLEYIIQEHVPWQIKDYEIEGLLQERRVLLLLDGLDEVKIEDTSRVTQEIQSFTDNFHGNRFVLTCRIAALEYVFEQFTEVEIADFTAQQIEVFSRNWFIYKQIPEKADLFLDKLRQSPRIQELATNPLLLTMLCLVFEVESDFPMSRAELYSDATYTLLRRWDASRNIERNPIYQDLSVERKKALLSHIALKAFERSEIFFKKQTLATYIADYMVNIPSKRRRKLLPYEMEADGERTLRSIEAQHGLLVERAYNIYSFSHLSFQEYFAAYAISYEHDLEDIQLAFDQIKDKQWHEVFRLAISMSPRADGLVKFMKKKADEILADQPPLLEFLEWLNRKSRSVKVQKSQYFIRSFYYMYSMSQEKVISPVNAESLNPEMDLDRILIIALNSVSKFLKMPVSSPEYMQTLLRIEQDLQKIDRMVRQDSSISAEFRSDWAKIIETAHQFQQWCMLEDWMEHLRYWATKLRHIVIVYRDVGHDWNFNPVQLDILLDYYNANKLLMDCLNSDCYVNRNIQRKIKETLFSPA